MARSGEPWMPRKEKPAHLVRSSTDNRTMCGIRIAEPTALPYLLAAYLPQHEAGARSYGLPFHVCPDCWVRQ